MTNGYKRQEDEPKVIFSAELTRETDKAFLLDSDDYGEKWWPKSQCEQLGENQFEATQWIIDQKERET